LNIFSVYQYNNQEKEREVEGGRLGGERKGLGVSIKHSEEKEDEEEQHQLKPVGILSVYNEKHNQIKMHSVFLRFGPEMSLQ
jgi:hypothetical protein